MMKLLWSYIFLLLTTTVFCQSYTTKKTATGKAKSAYDAGMKYNFGGQNEKALKEFTDALKEDPTFIDAQLQQAAMLYELGRNAEAEVAFEKVIKIDPNYNSQVFYVLGNAELRQEKYLEAADHYEAYTKSSKTHPDLLKKAEKAAKDCRFIPEALKNPVPFEPKSLGEKVNTTQSSEYLPVITADGETLVFTRLVGKQEDFYFSKKVNDQWMEAKAINEVNTDDNEGAQCLSADGKVLYFTGCNRPNGLGSCDIFFSKYQNGKWTAPKGFAAINTEYWDSQPSVSADGRTVYFASNRPGGLGGIDIWYVYFENGKWSEAKNMGKPVNSSYDDQTPHIHPDGQTLYFTSEGHPSMGGKDLYLARINEDGTWGEPMNLGYPINTKDNEGTLSVSLDGKTAYFGRGSKTTEGTLNYDLFSFDLYEKARPKPVTYVKARVMDAETHQPISNAKLELMDLGLQKPTVSAITDEVGEFLMCLPFGKNYSLTVSKQEYIFHSENFNLTEVGTYEKPYIFEINLLPLKKAESVASATNPEIKLPPKIEPQPIILKNVFFDTDKADLRPESYAELNKLKQLLLENLEMKIQLRGHTDSQGSDTHNLDLSDRRAKAVMAYLIKNGISASRLDAKGFGETMPIDSNDTPKGRQNNRRTEFIILK
jgi:outer membrane protein OmpA-like peptidoglycan-associated protein/tetratricopeptide (TPR) repeat protein